MKKIKIMEREYFRVKYIIDSTYDEFISKGKIRIKSLDVGSLAWMTPQEIIKNKNICYNLHSIDLDSIYTLDSYKKMNLDFSFDISSKTISIRSDHGTYKCTNIHEIENNSFLMSSLTKKQLITITSYFYNK